MLNNKPFWITLPVYKGKNIPIKNLEIADNNIFKRKHLGAIKSAYKKTKYFDQIYPEIEKIYSKNIKQVSEFNMELIKSFMNILNIDTSILFASELMGEEESLSLKGNEMVLTLAKRACAKTYISGTGCKDFIKPSTFENNNIKFIFNKVNLMEYYQYGNNEKFISNLSIIDSLFNLGSSELNNLLQCK